MPFTSKGVEFSDSDKFQYYQFELYEESAPENWLEILKKSGLEFAVSPKHQPEDGKPHFHVIYRQAGGPVVFKTACKRILPLKIAANGYIEPCFHPKNAMRYLIHLDDPDKEQFGGGRNAITIINNFPLSLKRELTPEQVADIRKKCFSAIREYSFVEYHELIDYCMWIIGDDEMLDYACSHTILFKGYLDSLRNSARGGCDD